MKFHVTCQMSSDKDVEKQTTNAANTTSAMNLMNILNTLNTKTIMNKEHFLENQILCQFS